MKFFFNIIIVVFLAFGILKIFLGNDKTRPNVITPPKVVEIQTFSSSKKVVDKVFKKNEKMTSNKQVLESPPSLDGPHERNQSENTIDGRVVLGMDFMPMKNVPPGYAFENEINPNWKAMAIKEFVDEEDTANVEIDHLESQVFVREGVALYIEKVKIRVSEMDGLGGEFMAYVDSSTGEVLHAWDPGSKPFEEQAIGDAPLDGFDDYPDTPYEENDEISTNAFDGN